MNIGRKRASAVVVIALIMGGIAIYLKFANNHSDFDVAPSPIVKNTIQVSAIVLKGAPISEEIVSVGTIIPDEMVDLAFETSGKIVAIYFKEGTKVSQGDLLARINDAPLQAQLHKLEVEKKLLEARIYRQEALLSREAISQETYEIISTDLEKLEADIELIQAQIAQKELRAPFDGIIGLRNISEGSFATTGTSVAKLTRTKPVKLEFAYPERYSNLVKVGSEVNFMVTGELEPLTAKVYAIESVVDETRNQRARAIYPNNSNELVPGRFFSIRIKLQEEQNAISVPSEAIIKEMGKDIVYRFHSGKAEAVEVSLGIRNESSVEVRSGLQQGDTIITTGIMQMRQGIDVKLISVEQ